MNPRILGVPSLPFLFLALEAYPSQAQSPEDKSLAEQAAKAMGDLQALRSLKNQVVEAENNQVIYLPREKFLIEADHMSPRKGQFRPGPLPVELLRGIDKLKLDVTTIAGIHGDTASMEALRAAAKTGQK